MEKYKFYASDYCALDSNVYTGGGTDDTEALQKILDTAPVNGRVHLVLDGAALVRGLVLHSNTVIECPDPSCGLFLADSSNNFLLTNSNKHLRKIQTFNVILQGGTYNHNAKGQEIHHVDESDPLSEEYYVPSAHGKIWKKYTFAFEFAGIKDFTMRDVTVRNQRVWTMLCANWERVNIENFKLDLTEHLYAQNQDGLHFHGPGRFLNIRNMCGTAGDDIIAIAPDELDCVSDITDVVIDGLMLNNSDQAIRLLSRDKGRIDRVTIKNVTGTFNSYGFFINPWTPEKKGNIGTLYFENINLDHEKPTYDYTPPLLFRIGGKAERIVMKNIFWHAHDMHYNLLEIGPNTGSAVPGLPSEIGHIDIDGLFITEDDNIKDLSEYIKVSSNIDELTIRNVFSNSKVPLIKVVGDGRIGKLNIK